MTLEICKECLLYRELNEYGRCSSCEDKKYILSELNNEKDNLNKQIQLIEKLKIKPVTEVEWHELCKTPVRNENISLKIAQVTFPQGINFKMNPNEISFEMNGFNILIPTSAMKGITIDMKWYKAYLLEEFKPQDKYKKMKKYFNLIDKGNYKWYELAECRCNVNFSKLQLFKWWFLKGKWHKVNRKRWEERFELEDKENEEKYLNHKKYQENISNKIKELHEVVDILKEWGEVKGYFLSSNGLYETVNIEKFLR